MAFCLGSQAILGFKASAAWHHAHSQDLSAMIIGNQQLEALNPKSNPYLKRLEDVRRKNLSSSRRSGSYPNVLNSVEAHPRSEL